MTKASGASSRESSPSDSPQPVDGSGWRPGGGNFSRTEGPPLVVPCGFQEAIVDQLVEHDCLVVMAKGLAVHSVILQFVRRIVQDEVDDRRRKRKFREINEAASTSSTSLSRAGDCREQDQTPSAEGNVDGDDGNAVEMSDRSGSSSGGAAVPQAPPPLTKHAGGGESSEKLILMINTTPDEVETFRRRVELFNGDQWRDDDEDDDNSLAQDGERRPGEPKNAKKNGHPRSSSSSSPPGKGVCASYLGLPFHSVTAEMPVSKRLGLYSTGGLLAVTGRIAVTDFLTGRLPAAVVSGLIVNHAHKLPSGSWNAAFILRMYRRANKVGFVKGFSDRPEAFVRRFALAEHVMKLMAVTKLYLHPRSHESVQSSLEAGDYLAYSAICQPEDKNGQEAEIIDNDDHHVLGENNGKDDDTNSHLQSHEKATIVEQSKLVDEQLVTSSLLSSSSSSSPSSSSSAMEGVGGFRRKRRRRRKPENHEAVDESVRFPQPHTEERMLKLTSTAAQVQDAILQMITSGLNELKKNKVADLENMDTDEYLFKAVDAQLQEMLEPVWNTLGFRARKLIQDLGHMRKLLIALIQMNCVHFYQHLTSLRVSNMLDSSWFLTPQADILFRKAKERAYSVERGRDGKKSALRLVLEVDPKWRELVAILVNVRISPSCLTKLRLNALRRSGDLLSYEQLFNSRTVKDDEDVQPVTKRPALGNAKPAHHLDEDDEDDESSEHRHYGVKPDYRILIVVNDTYAARMVAQVLLFGSDAVLKESFRSFLASSREEAARRTAVSRKTAAVGAGRGVGRSDLHHFAAAGAGTMTSAESLLLSKFAEKLGNAPLYKQPALLRRFGGKVGAPKADEFAELIDEIVNSLKLPVALRPQITTVGHSPGHLGVELRAFQPHCVILVDADVESVREIEVYCAELSRAIYFASRLAASSSSSSTTTEGCDQTVNTNYDNDDMIDHRRRGRCTVKHPWADVAEWTPSGDDLTVYMLMYEKTVEQHRFINSLKAEEHAWEDLQRQKKHLLVPVDEIAALSDEAFQDVLISFLDSSTATTVKHGSTRRGGGLRHALSMAVKPTVVVDMREFRSSLPFQLYCRNMMIVPMTIAIGDYVLSRDVCVERKGVQDLFQSMNSGRLYHQCQELCRYYKTPVVLIEFERGKQFALQSRDAIGTEIDPTNILSKLVLLILHFPALGFLWSPDSHYTAALFLKAKEGRQEPDIPRAAALGGAAADPSPPPAAAASMTDQQMLQDLEEDDDRLINKNFVSEVGGILPTGTDKAGDKAPVDSSLIELFAPVGGGAPDARQRTNASSSSSSLSVSASAAVMGESRKTQQEGTLSGEDKEEVDDDVLADIRATADVPQPLREASRMDAPAPATEGTAALARTYIESEASNSVAVDMLRMLPGVNHVNIQTIFRRVRSLAALAELSKEDLVEMLGRTNGETLFNFLHLPMHGS